jgi:hypothetical protein
VSQGKKGDVGDQPDAPLVSGREIVQRIMNILGVSREPAIDVASRLLQDGHLLLEDSGRQAMLLKDDETKYQVLDLDQVYPEVLLEPTTDWKEASFSSFASVHPTELARQMTLLELEWFRAILPRELTRKGLPSGFVCGGKSVVRFSFWVGCECVCVCVKV